MNLIISQELTMDIYWFYLTTMSYMIALSITFFHDVKRKDFWGMLAHHVVTILLLCISWIISAFRIGIVVIVLLDLTETWLEVGHFILTTNTYTSVYMCIDLFLWYKAVNG